MTIRPYLFTSESVSEGHPDKVCDRISDMVVDTYLSSGDPQTRVACETLTTTNKVVLAGEVRGPSISKDQIISQVRDCIRILGMSKMVFIGKIVKLTIIYTLNRQILPWELTQEVIRKKELVIKGLCLDMHAVIQTV